MKKTIEQLRDEHKLKPIEVGDYVTTRWQETKVDYEYEGKGKKRTSRRVETEVAKSASGTVKLIDAEGVHVYFSHSQPNKYIRRDDYTYVMPLESLEQSMLYVGADPFEKDNHPLNYVQQSMTSLMHYMDADINLGNGKSYSGTDFDPYVVDKDGNRQYFQRGLVWPLEAKQSLIDSIYNHLDIGKFVLAETPWHDIQSAMDAGEHAYSCMCIDGKQRMNAIHEFTKGGFPDSHGNYWDDLSPSARNKFMNRPVSVCLLSDTTLTPSLIKQIFLGVNFSGVPMSKEHIEFVKSIKV